MEIFELPRHQSESLLRSGTAGRIALCTADGPYVVPVNYSVVDESVVIRTAPDSFLASHAHGAQVAFEVDQFDYENHRGWSVVARGTAQRVDSVRELSHIMAVWEPLAWPDGPRPVFLRFPWQQITGRRLGADWSIERNLAVNRMAPIGVTGA